MKSLQHSDLDYEVPPQFSYTAPPPPAKKPKSMITDQTPRNQLQNNQFTEVDSFDESVYKENPNQHLESKLRELVQDKIKQKKLKLNVENSSLEELMIALRTIEAFQTRKQTKKRACNVM